MSRRRSRTHVTRRQPVPPDAMREGDVITFVDARLPAGHPHRIPILADDDIARALRDRFPDGLPVGTRADGVLKGCVNRWLKARGLRKISHKILQRRIRQLTGEDS
jgi:hypothetical protein